MSMAPKKRDASAAAGRRSHQTPTGVRQGGRCRSGASVRAWDWQREARARPAAVRRAFPPPPPPSPPPLWRGAGEDFYDARELAPLTPAPAPCGGTACAPALLRLLAHAAAVPAPCWRPVRTLPQFDSRLEPWVVRSERCIRPRKFARAPSLARAGARGRVQTRVRGAPPVCASLLSGVCALVSKSRGVCLQRWNFPRELQLYASRGSALALHVRA